MKSNAIHHYISLIVPIYKQERTIIKNLHQIKQVLDGIRYDYEIIAVVDGRLDRSFDRIKQEHIPKVRAISYEKNQGKSFAIRTGMERAKGDYIMFLDAGFDIDPNGISMLIEHMEWYNADIIVGSKRHPASMVHYSPARKILSYGYFMLVKLLFGIQVRDTQAGIKIFKKNVLAKILPRLVEKKFAGDLEMLVVASALGYKRIFEAPIKLDYSLGGITSAATFESIIGILVDTCAIFYRRYILRYYSKSHSRPLQADIDITLHEFL